MYNVKNVTYKNILEIDSIKIIEKRVTCILGPSGSGKTTFLKLLNRLISPDKGTITYFEKNLNDLDPIELRRKVVMLAQTPIIFSGTIRDNILIGLKFAEKKIEISDTALKEILSEVRINKSLQKPASELSVGEKQRITLARVLVMEPETLLLDEPSSALDKDTELFVFSRIYRYVKNNDKTLIMVTHSEQIAKRFSNIIIRFKQGRIIKR